MTKKKLDITSITNELRGQSGFFPTNPSPSTQELTQVPSPLPAQREQRPREPKVISVAPTKKAHSDRDTVVSRHHDTVIDTTIPSNHDTTIPETEDEMLEAVRKAVKQIGKEPATQRLTLEEKQALRSIEFTYAQQGIMTSGNEMIRIGMNFILKDYQKNGENSILANVLKRLNF